MFELTAIRTFLLCATLVITNIAGCKKPSHPTDKEIRVGALFPMTGRDALYGQEAMRGLEIALKQVNQERQAHSLNIIRIVVRDTQSKEGVSSIAVRDLIYRQGVSALIGELDSGRCMEAAPIAERSGIPFITPAATNDRVTELGQYIFRTCFENSRQAKAMAEFAWNSGFRRVALLIDFSNSYSSNLSQNFDAAFRELGGTIVSFPISDLQNASPQVLRMQSEEADLLVMPLLHLEGALAARKIRESGLNTPILGGDGWDTPDLKTWSNFIEGSYFVRHFLPYSDNSEAARFSKEYQTLFGGQPSALSALTHDAVLILAEALRDNNATHPEKIRKNLLKIRNLPVATGIFSFASNRNPRKNIFVTRMEKGEFIPCATLDP